MPPEFVPVYSEQHQRWYFAKTAGFSQWEDPGYLSAMPAYGGSGASRGFGGGDAYGAPSGPPPGADYRGDGAVAGEKKNNDKRNMILGAAGGLAVGAVGAAVIADALGMFPVLLLSFPDFNGVLNDMHADPCWIKMTRMTNTVHLLMGRLP